MGTRRPSRGRKAGGGDGSGSEPGAVTCARGALKGWEMAWLGWDATDRTMGNLSSQLTWGILAVSNFFSGRGFLSDV